MPETTVTYESRDRIATITINRPEKLNTIDTSVAAGLLDAWKRLNASDDRVAILTGAGERAFCAGADLDDPGQGLWPFTPGVGVEVAKPIVCAVNGFAIGGGVVLVQFADLAVASDHAFFSYPEAKVGFTGGLIASLACRIPHKIAMEMILLGERIGAERAREAGLVNRVVPPGEVMPSAREYAERLARNAPLVLSTLKDFVGRTVPKGPTELAGHARHMTERTSASEDLAEGIAAFRDRREPEFRGR